jgi:hypothetical protein
VRGKNTLWTAFFSSAVQAKGVFVEAIAYLVWGGSGGERVFFITLGVVNYYGDGA